MPTQREEEQAQLILYLIKANAEHLKDLSESVGNLAAAVAGDHARINNLETQQANYRHTNSELAKLKAEMQGDLSQRPTIKQMLAAAVALVTVAGMLGFGIAEILQ